MKAITVSQPFAQLVACGLKTNDSKGWSTVHRGLLAIHSSVSFPLRVRQLCASEPFKSALLKRNPYFAEWDWLPKDSLAFPLGYILAYAELVDVRRTEDFKPSGAERRFGNYGPGRFVWLLANVKPLKVPVRTVGALGLWDWQPRTESAVESEQEATEEFVASESGDAGEA